MKFENRIESKNRNNQIAAAGSQYVNTNKNANKNINKNINKNANKNAGKSKNKEDSVGLKISDEGKELLREQSTEKVLVTKKTQAYGPTSFEIASIMEDYYNQLESAKAVKEAFEDIAKMMEIARRISNGDKVPSLDEKKLMEFNAKLYQAAKTASMLHEGEKHKKHKSMFEEEEENSIDRKVRELESESPAESEEAAAEESDTDGSLEEA